MLWSAPVLASPELAIAMVKKGTSVSSCESVQGQLGQVKCLDAGRMQYARRLNVYSVA